LLSSLRFLLALALAVLCVRANHTDHAAAMNDLALHADFLYRCPNFHFLLLRLFRLISLPEDAGLKAPALHPILNRRLIRRAAHF
jgi:hypothetical protein